LKKKNVVSWVIPSQLDKKRKMTPMITDLFDYFLPVNFNQLQENASYHVDTLEF
jgi:hypothetical protein